MLRPVPRTPLFNFILHPVEETAGWSPREPGGPEWLHWWGLTDSYYWMNAGGVELMRYSDRLIAANPQWDHRLPYFNYQVARLHDDLLAILPHVLERVPADIFGRVATPEQMRRFRALIDAWANEHWPRDVSTPVLRRREERASRLYVDGFEWLHISRQLSGGHLPGQPRIAFLSCGDRLSIVWLADESVQATTGIRWSDTPDGMHTMSCDEFIAEVRDFDERLMNQMAERVKIVRTAWPRPDVCIDIPELVSDHYERQHMLDAALDEAARTETDWDAVRRAIETIERQAGA